MGSSSTTGPHTTSIHGTYNQPTTGKKDTLQLELLQTGQGEEWAATQKKYTSGLQTLRQELEERATLHYSGNTDAGQAALHKFWQHQALTPMTVYSDASVNDKCEDFLAYLRKEGGTNVRASAAVVLTSDPMDTTALVRAVRASTTDPTMGATSFNIEMAAIDMAGLVRGHGMQAAVGVTDSQSSVKHLAGTARKSRGCSRFLCETGRAEWSKKEGRILRFQPSHAERRSIPEHCTTDEWRNTLVDVAAGADSNSDLVTTAKDVWMRGVYVVLADVCEAAPQQRIAQETSSAELVSRTNT